MYKLEFEGNDKGIDRYEICTQAFIMTNKVPQPGEYDDVVGVMRKLKAIGKPANVIQGKQLYDLQNGGGQIELERSEYKCLLEYVKHPIWMPISLEQQGDVKRWLEGSTEGAGASPELVK